MTKLEHSETCDRNKEPIFAILKEVLADKSRVLEIGSGTGQHAVFFARNLDHVTWRPSDRIADLSALQARLQLEGPANVREPLQLDVADEPWPAAIRNGGFDAVFTANTLHIMSWSSVERCFQGLGATLASGAVLCVYGPFRYDGAFTTPSNERFDQWLKERDPVSGVRDFEAVNELAGRQDMKLLADHQMPANNQLLVWRRK